MYQLTYIEDGHNIILKISMQEFARWYDSNKERDFCLIKL